MRELPQTGPLLLPTVVDLLAGALGRVSAAALWCTVLGLVLLVPAWRLGSNNVPDRPVRAQSQSQDQPTLKSTSALHPLDGTDEIAHGP